MTDSNFNQRRQSRWVRWLVSLSCLLLIAGVTRVMQVTQRQNRIIAHLERKEFVVDTIPLIEDPGLGWVDLNWIPMPCRVVTVSDYAGTCDDADLRLIGELFALTWSNLHEARACDLDVTSTDITNAGLQNLRDCSAIRRLAIGSDQITDVGIAHLARLTNLEELDLRGCDITDRGLIHLRQLTSITHLDLDELSITDAGLDRLHDLSNLKHLSLGYTGVTDAGLEKLASLSRLEYLSLSGTKISNSGLVHLTRLTNLSALSLTNTKVTNAALIDIRKLGKLENLFLERTLVTDSGLLVLADVKTLKYALFPSPGVSAAALNRLKVALPGLRVTPIYPNCWGPPP